MGGHCKGGRVVRWRFSDLQWKRRRKTQNNIKIWTLSLRNNNEVGKWIHFWKIDTASTAFRGAESSKRLFTDFSPLPQSYHMYIHPELSRCTRSWSHTCYVLSMLPDSAPVFFRFLSSPCPGRLPWDAIPPGLYHSICNCSVSTLKIIFLYLVSLGPDITVNIQEIFDE